MGKKKSETFQKVKLKVGRTLPKGTNVTDTSFKARKIRLPDQQKHHAGNDQQENLALDILELLKKLHHPNAQTKIFTLNKIRKFLASESNDSQTYLWTILDGVCKLMLENDEHVRKETLSVIALVLKKFALMKKNLNLQVLKSHIRCATTSINLSIRHDAMKLLDIVLDVLPGAICSSRVMLDNFMSLISSSNGKSKSQSMRFLNIAPDEDITAQEWRVCVLKRLEKFLKANCTILSNENKSDAEFRWSSGDVTYCRFFDPHNVIPVRSSFSLLSQTGAMNDDCNSSLEFVKNFLSEMKPLLFGIWVEALPLCKLGVNVGVLLEENSKEVLTIILRVLSLIMDWIELLEDKYKFSNLKHYFALCCHKDIQSHMMPIFPLEVPERIDKHRQRQKSGPNIAGQCLELNLYICKLFCALTPEIKNSKESKRCLDYLLQVMKAKQLRDSNTLSTWLKILDHFMANYSEESRLDLHLSALLHFYNQLSDIDSKKLIVKFFFDLSLDMKRYNDLPEIGRVLESWMLSLPTEFMHSQAIFKTILHEPLKKLVCLGHPSILEGLQNCSMETIRGFNTSNYDSFSHLQNTEFNREPFLLFSPCGSFTNH